MTKIIKAERLDPGLIGRFTVRRFAKWFGIALALLVVVIVSLPFLINVDQFRPTLQSDLSSALGREVTLGNLHLKILTGEVTADDLSVAEDPAFGKPAFIRAKSLHVGVEIWPFLFQRKLIVTDLLIDQPDIALMQSGTGDWNFSGLGKSKTAEPSSARMPLDLSVKIIKITNGRLTLSRRIGHWKPLALEQTNIEVAEFFKHVRVSVFSFGEGGGRGRGQARWKQAGPIDATDSARDACPKVNLKVTQLDLARSGMNDIAPDVSGPGDPLTAADNPMEC